METMRPTKPANQQPDTYESPERPEQKPKHCPHCGAEHRHPYSFICGRPECIAEEAVAPLTRWAREVVELTQAEAVAICDVKPCAKCGRNLIGPWDKHARCEERHELEWEELRDV